MLVLTRNISEKIVIGDEVTIEILSVSGEGVRIGISAPRATPIHRYEVFTEIEKANQAANIVLSEIGQADLENLTAHIVSK
jgi:carbon storage regulator